MYADENVLNVDCARTRVRVAHVVHVSGRAARTSAPTANGDLRPPNGLSEGSGGEGGVDRSTVHLLVVAVAQLVIRK